MQHSLVLARKGVGLASPNPTVGCVIVRDGQIVGEGFHQHEWRDHAEIVALKSAKERAHGATLYVTLEPCNHKGRTRSEEHTSELQSHHDLVCRLLLEK